MIYDSYDVKSIYGLCALNQTPGQLVLVGRHMADELELPINVIPDEERCIVVVQGGASDASA